MIPSSLLLGLLVPAVSAILLPNNPSNVEGQTSGSKSSALPTFQTFDFKQNDALVRPLVMAPPVPSVQTDSVKEPLPIALSSSKLLNDIFGKQQNIPTIIQTSSDIGTSGNVQTTTTGKGTKDKSTGIPKGVAISPPENSIVNNFIPPVAVSNNKDKVLHRPENNSTDAKIQQLSDPRVQIMSLINKSNDTNPIREAPMTVYPFFGGKKDTKKHGGQMLTMFTGTKNGSQLSGKSNILAGSQVQSLIANLTPECQASFKSLSATAMTSTTQDFKTKFAQWGASCGKGDIVNELTTKTETMQKNYHDQIDQLVAALPGYYKDLRAIEANQTLVSEDKMQAVLDYMSGLPTKHRMTVKYINQLFVEDAIKEILPAAKVTEITNQINSLETYFNAKKQGISPSQIKVEKKQKRSVEDESSAEEDFETAGDELTE